MKPSIQLLLYLALSQGLIIINPNKTFYDTTKRHSQNEQVMEKHIDYKFFYFNIFLITPWYDFKDGSFHKPTLCKLYGYSLILAKISLSFATIYDIFQKDRLLRRFVFTQAFIHLLNTVILCTIVVLTVAKTVSDVKNWKILLEKCGSIEGTSHTEKPLKFWLLQFTFVTVITYCIYVYHTFFGVPLWKCIFFAHAADSFYQFMLTRFLQSVVETIKSGYENLNQKLILDSKSKIVVRNLTRRYCFLGKMLEGFNDMFGYQLALIIIYDALHMINSFTFALLCINMEALRPVLWCVLTAVVLPFFLGVVYIKGEVCTNLFLFLFQYVFVSLIFAMDSTTKEARKFLDVCHRMQDQFEFNSSEVKILRRTTKYCEYFFRNFSAGGFFVIDKSIIFAVMENVLTYTYSCYYTI